MDRRILICSVMVLEYLGLAWAQDRLISPSKLEKFVDEITEIPTIEGFDVVNGFPVAKSLRIGMFSKKWKFHRDLPPTQVFAYGLSKEEATVPGPTIEAQQGISTSIKWENHLPTKHILPFDRTIPTAHPRTNIGIPTVVHLHGHIGPPATDGHATSWFTSQFSQCGPSWSRKTYIYNNKQHPGTLWYHDHAMGLTRVNLLAGLVGAYLIRHHPTEQLGVVLVNKVDRLREKLRTQQIEEWI
ncbi:Multicopper oxidase LPR1 [Striga hermonthica]|uniref:Multicopper oxidase LPR1 n=1 Tax=Striga hermonthica TaxID=68872 RepID=A0A9N7N7D4_STRHE|nr:Multicopper oxidase LPR1 [Striga hermonthica]